MGVATTLAIVGGAASLAGTVSSFSQAAKQNRLMTQAQRDAEKAMADARKKLEMNYYAKMGVNKEPYELEREAQLVQGAEAIQAGREQERGAAATAGRVQLAMNEAGAATRTAMGKEMFELDKLKAEEDSRLRDVGAQIDLQEAQGQQQMAADAQSASAAATAQGWQGVTSLGQQALQAVPLYGKSPMEGDLDKSQKKIVKRMANRAKSSEPAQTISSPFKGISDSSIKLKPMYTDIGNEDYNPFDIFLNNRLVERKF